MNAAEIATMLGGAQQKSGSWWRCRCPAHGSTSLSLSMRDGHPDGLVVKCWGGCNWRDVLAELQRLGLTGHPETCVSPDPDARRREATNAADRARRVANALDLYLNQTRPAVGTIVEHYLESRGILSAIPPCIRRSTHWLRHRESGGAWPAMVSLVEHVEHGRVGCHITYLAIDGSQKATVTPVRRSLGPIRGGAVNIADADETLMVGEGIETCLSAMQSTQMPAWAALSTSGLRSLILPSVVRTVIVLVDNDVNGAGEYAARAAARRWLAEGRQVRLAIPPEPGTDFNDVIVGRHYARTIGPRDAVQ